MEVYGFVRDSFACRHREVEVCQCLLDLLEGHHLAKTEQRELAIHLRSICVYQCQFDWPLSDHVVAPVNNISVSHTCTESRAQRSKTWGRLE